MQAYYNINNLVESMQRHVNLSASLPLSFNCAHLYFHFLHFCKGLKNPIDLGGNPLEKITVYQQRFDQLQLDLLFKMISLPATFLMFIWFASMQVLKKNLFFNQRIACHNKCAIHAIQQ